MTILPPSKPGGPTRHRCDTPLGNLLDISIPAYESGSLWECPECGRWWKYHVFHVFDPEWYPVPWYDIPARRRIAAHETEKWHARLRMTYQRTTARLHWWDCHPNPNRGRP